MSDTVFADDLRQRIGADLDRLETQYQQARSRAIDGALEALIAERLIAAAARERNSTPQELIAARQAAVAEPSDQEIAGYYAANTERFRGAPLEQVRPQIVALLRGQARSNALQAFRAELRQQADVRYVWEPFRADLDNAGAPALGNPRAPVTVVEFSDFECPFCERFAPTLKRLTAEFGNDVHVVYRQLPVPQNHRHALRAAEASLCAHEQDRFWEMHDLLFAEADRLSDPDLQEKARRLGLDMRRYDACMQEGRFAERVQADMAEAARLAVPGTPAVFINGVLQGGGAVQYEAVAAAVRRELERVRVR